MMLLIANATRGESLYATNYLYKKSKKMVIQGEHIINNRNESSLTSEETILPNFATLELQGHEIDLGRNQSSIGDSFSISLSLRHYNIF